jgi:colicin import membrane protein
MIMIQKYRVFFALALGLHLSILALFGLSFSSEDERVKQKPLPEIIQASMLDEDIIIEEANRLKNKENNKRQTQKKQQQKLENERKKEQKLLQETKKKRQQEEKKTKQQEKKRKQLAVKEKQKLDEIKKLKAQEAAKLAKIKKQKAAEKKQRDDLRKAEAKKQKDLLAKKKAQEAEKAAKSKQQADDVAKAKIERDRAAKAKVEQNRKATISATAAIQLKVNNRWIRPISSTKGLNCTIRVKLLPSGDVMDAAVVRSSGDRVFDRSAENAVRKASPLPVPKDRNLFTRKFRTFTFEFKPE